MIEAFNLISAKLPNAKLVVAGGDHPQAAGYTDLMQKAVRRIILASSSAAMFRKMRCQICFRVPRRSHAVLFLHGMQRRRAPGMRLWRAHRLR